LFQTVGIVGRNPETKDTRSGEITVFSLAVNKSYDRGDQPDWYDVAVFSEDLQRTVQAEIYKGAKVAVEGSLKIKEGGSRPYRDIAAARVGLVEWLRKDQVAGGRKAEPASAVEEPTEEVEEEEFPF
jgi:single-stranded DNA-binding protein